MFAINEDLSIHITRGDVVAFYIEAENNGKTHTFLPGDVLRLKVFAKKACDNVMLQRDFPVLEETQKVSIGLSSQDTKIGAVISKPVDYWYEVELIQDGNAQTIIGYDENGPKIFRIFPEGRD